MRTILDEATSWFLEQLAYTDHLRVSVVEGILSATPEDVQVGSHVIKDMHRVEPSSESRRVSVRFTEIITWQVVDESYTSWGEGEVRDGKGFLVALTRSAYLRYVEENHGWYKDIVGPAIHYRLWTEDEVVDVVACAEPVVELIPGT